MRVMPIDMASTRAMLTDGGEFAVLDVRGNEDFACGHLLPAINTPLDRIEGLVRDFVPRLSTRIVLCDADDGLAVRAAGLLGSMGYSDLYRLDGGVHAWAVAGHELFETSYAMANCFGLFVQERYGVPRIAGPDFKARLEAGEKMLVVDSRPFDEFHAATVPGAINIPVVELIHRIDELLPDSEIPVVVHCGGKTRGILGCQTLIDAGLENPVFSLDEGTCDWVLAGGVLEPGASRIAGPATTGARDEASRAAQRIAEQLGIRSIAPEELEVWRRESGQRTLYLIDVRTAEEFNAGHLPDSRSIPGGQLAGCTEEYIATRNARLCLVDDDGARATFTACWMIRQGWPDVAVLAGGIAGHDLVVDNVTLSTDIEPVDISEAPDDAAVVASSRQSVQWRRDLLERFDRDGSLTFVPPPTNISL